MSDHVHLWSDFENVADVSQPVRHCILCPATQTWDEAHAPGAELGLWFNHWTKTLDERQFGSVPLAEP